MHISQSVCDFIGARCTSTGGEFTMCEGGQVTLYSSCFSAMTLNHLDLLSDLPASDRALWADYINSWQDGETGLFIGPEIVPEELTSPIHDYEHCTMHLAAHALPALSLLGARPRYPLRFAHKFLDLSELRAWLEARDWREAWVEGNNLVFVGQFLVHMRDVEGLVDASPALELYFDWLDSQLDPETGLWGTNGFCDAFPAMCGGYHQLILYYYEGREVLFKERLINTVLALQHPDGGWNPNGGGGACEAVDAIHILANMYKQTDYRRSDIRRSLERALPSIIEKQMPDGGFVYRLDTPFSQMGIHKTSCPRNVSHLFPTWFYVHALALISQVVPDPRVKSVNWRFNDSCSMGWHMKLAINHQS